MTPADWTDATCDRIAAAKGTFFTFMHALDSVVKPPVDHAFATMDERRMIVDALCWAAFAAGVSESSVKTRHEMATQRLDELESVS